METIKPGWRWIWGLLFNLLTVAGLGTLLRLKMLVPIPGIHHIHLLNAHSHMAFIGWIGLALMVFIVNILRKSVVLRPIFNSWFLPLYNFTAWLILVSFVTMGYNFISMALLCINIVLNLWFGIEWIHARQVFPKGIFKLTLDRAILFLWISAIGPLLLGVMSATGYSKGFAMQNAVYFFLHFQYNGWFIFGCLSILSSITRQAINSQFYRTLQIYSLFVFMGITLLLLFKQRPDWVVVVNFFNAILLIGALRGFILYFKEVLPQFASLAIPLKILLGLSLAGFLLKMTLQIVSAVPYISYLVYSHRAIAIGYLHLVFLIVVSFFLLFCIIRDCATGTGIKLALWIFVTGVLGNEIVLASQGASAIFSFPVPYAMQLLFICSFLMFSGILMLFTTLLLSRR